MFSYLERRTKEDAVLYIIFYLIFAAFLRVGEFIYLNSDRGKVDFNK